MMYNWAHHQYPYSDPYRYNNDWEINTVKQMLIEFARLDSEQNDLESQFIALKEYVDNYFASTDFSAMIREVLDEMYNDGRLGALLLASFRIIDVTTYGAVGDGVTNDQSAIQTAISNLQPFDTLWFPPNKTFNFDEVNVSVVGVTITGGGRIMGSITIGTYNTSGTLMYNTITNLTFSHETMPAKSAIVILNGRHIQIHHNWFRSSQNCIYVPGNIGFHAVGTINISDNYAINVSHFFAAADSVQPDQWQYMNDITISRNYLNYAALFGIYINYGIDGIKILDNTMFFPSYNAPDVLRQAKVSNIYISGTASDFITIEGNTLFESGLEAIFLNNAKNISIQNNMIAWSGQRQPSTAIKVVGSQAVGGIISGNIVNLFSNNAIGIEADQSMNISVYGNISSYVYPYTQYFGTTDLSTIPHYNVYAPTAYAQFSSISNNYSNMLDNIKSGQGAITTFSRYGAHSAVDTHRVVPTGTSVQIGNFLSRDGFPTTWSGLVILIARNNQFSTTANTASYVFYVQTSTIGSTLDMITSNGMTSGGGGSWPSFTFSVSGTTLTATPIASTGANVDFYFRLMTFGDLLFNPE